MLNYLFENFDEKENLITKIDGGAATLERFIKNRCAPRPSYVLCAQLSCSSYFGAYNDKVDLQFFATGQSSWITQLQAKNIEQESGAKDHFFSRFSCAHRELATSALASAARALHLSVPKVTTAKLETTWQHFLDGTYGVCTKDGLPETIAQKQMLVGAIDSFVALTPPHKLPKQSGLYLQQLVDALDDVEPAFAPHERQRSSRQRCINEVRAKYLS